MVRHPSQLAGSQWMTDTAHVEAFFLSRKFIFLLCLFTNAMFDDKAFNDREL
jgi:hypothetical protein